MRKIYLLLFCVALAGCNVNTEIELYSEDLLQETAASDIPAIVNFTSFGDRSMCEMINNQATPVLKKIFKTAEYRECITDGAGQIKAVYDATLPLNFGDKHSGRPAVRVTNKPGSGDLSWVYIDMPEKGLSSLINSSSFGLYTSEQDVDKSISFRLVNNSKNDCYVMAASAYVNGAPFSMRDKDTMKLILERRKTASIRLSNVVIDAVSQYSDSLAFMAKCQS